MVRTRSSRLFVSISITHQSLPPNLSCLDSEFKECLNEFIRGFKESKVHSLAEIINFNIEHPELCLPPCMFSLFTHLTP